MLLRRSVRPLRSKANGLSSLARQTELQSPADSNPKSLCLNGRLKEALFEMAVLGTEVKFSCYDSLITECVNQRALREGQRVHAHMIKTRYLPPVYLGTRLLILYAKCDSLEDACNLLDRMPERNIVSWTAMISGYSQSERHAEALELFIRMLGTGTLSCYAISCTLWIQNCFFLKVCI